MKIILLNNIKTALIFLSISLLLAYPTMSIIEFAEKNAGIKNRVVIISYTVIVFIGYFILGRKFLVLQNTLLKNALSTVFVLIMALLLIAMKTERIFFLFLPSFPIAALSNLWLNQGLILVVIAVSSCLSVTLGMLSKTWGK